MPSDLLDTRGHETANRCLFKNYNGKCYGYVPLKGNILLEKNFKNANKKDSFVDDVLVIWCAKSPDKGPVIIGWYKNARVYREEKSTHISGDKLKYRIEADVINCVLIPENMRMLQVPRGKGGMGQKSIWYAISEKGESFVPKVIKYIDEFETRNDELGYDEILDEVLHYEGSIITVKVNKYERNPEARKKCIEKHGCQCKICGFDFEKVYGAFGKGKIHIHHIKPLNEIGKEYIVDPINDLIPVCPNCHMMLHSRKPAFTPHEETLSLFESKGIPVYRTDEQGDIVFTSTGHGFETELSPGLYTPGQNSSNSNTSEPSSSTHDSSSGSTHYKDDNPNGIYNQESTAPKESYKNCTLLREVYPNGVPEGHPAYESKHDRDKDGWACKR